MDDLPNISSRFDQELNPQQQAVVSAGPGPVLVIAGAGSGKTRTLTYRVAHLIESRVPAHSILLLTFTNKAAREMLQRVEELVPFEVRRIWGGTFHHIANRILRAHAERAGIDPAYTIMDQRDARNLLDSCLEDLGHKKKDSVIPQGAVLSRIVSLARNTCATVEDIVGERYPLFSEYCGEISEIDHHYTARKRKLNVLDFDDLLCLWLHVMESDASIREFYASRFSYILVDEYQDTNRLQASIIDTLAGYHKNVMVVGDDSQSIYSFRGADFLNIMDFPERYPDARVFKLEYNYRSSPMILDLANESIAYNARQFHKVLQPTIQGDRLPIAVAPADLSHQAHFVADTIYEHIAQGTPPDEIAVLYRAHYHSMELQMELTRRAIPFEVRSGLRFFEQAHVKDITSYLKILQNPRDETAWKRILELLPGIGRKTSQKICDRLLSASNPLVRVSEKETSQLVPKGARPYWSGLSAMVDAVSGGEHGQSPAALIKAAWESGYEDYLYSKYTDASMRGEDIQQLIEFSSRYESLETFLSELALLSSTDAEAAADRDSRGVVTLSTIHQAKGLEWSVVFLICLVEGRFPNDHNFERLDEEEEERRLFYVAVTRAKQHLYFCVPLTGKTNSGYPHPLRPSRFLRELPDRCYKKIEAPYC